MDELESLNHTKWDCKYHVVFIPKCRRKTLYLELRRPLGEVFRKLAGQREWRVERRVTVKVIVLPSGCVVESGVRLTAHPLRARVNRNMLK